MEKKVEMSLHDYSRIVYMLVISVKILDVICLENYDPNKPHYVDRKECPQDIKSLYSMFLHMDNELQNDVREKLGEDYLEKMAETNIESVLFHGSW